MYKALEGENNGNFCREMDGIEVCTSWPDFKPLVLNLSFPFLNLESALFVLLLSHVITMITN